MKRSLLRAATCALALACCAALEAQQTCPCSRSEDFGSCVHVTTPTGGYPGDFPGDAVVVVRPGAAASLVVPDLYTGFTFVYAAQGIGAGPTQTLVSPFGSAPTSGVAYDSAGDALYWVIEDRLVRSGVPTPDATDFPNVTVVGSIDLRAIAEAALGDANLAGTLGGLTYHAGRDRLWTVDIVNDIYFEIGKDGAISVDGDGVPVHFFSPRRGINGAYGNTLAYSTAGDAEYFDLLAGSAWEGRPKSVLRVLAPTDPVAAGVAIGADSGLHFPVIPDLVAPNLADVLVPMAIATQEDSCGAGQSSAYISLFDPHGAASLLVEVNADEPDYANVAELACEVQGGSAVQLTWESTRGYSSLRVVRSSLTHDDAGQQDVEVTRIDGIDLEGDPASDPGTATDVGLDIPVDGTYEYHVEATGPGGSVFDQVCVRTVGRGASRGRFDVVNRPENVQARRPPVAVGIATNGEELLVLDGPMGLAQRFTAEGTPAGFVTSPFRALGTTHGVEVVDERLYWLGRIEGFYYLQSTALDGSAPGTRQLVQTPTGLLLQPEYGDIAYDDEGQQLWTVDRANDILHAMQLDGLLGADALIANAGEGDHLGGAVEVTTDGDEGTVTIDFSHGQDDDSIYRLTRATFSRADGSLAETVYRLWLPSETDAADATATTVVTVGAEPQQLVVSAESRRVYRLTLAEAVIDGLPFRRGDANDDGDLNISDASFILRVLFLGDGATLACADAADTNDSGTIEISDAVAVFNYLFRGGDPLPAPFGECGFDTTPSDLDCDQSACVVVEP